MVRSLAIGAAGVAVGSASVVGVAATTYPLDKDRADYVINAAARECTYPGSTECWVSSAECTLGYEPIIAENSVDLSAEAAVLECEAAAAAYEGGAHPWMAPPVPVNASENGTSNGTNGTSNSTTATISEEAAARMLRSLDSSLKLHRLGAVGEAETENLNAIEESPDVAVRYLRAGSGKVKTSLRAMSRRQLGLIEVTVGVIEDGGCDMPKGCHVVTRTLGAVAQDALP